jgi:hypothetical protein
MIPNPLRGDGVLVLCEVNMPDGTRTRATCARRCGPSPSGSPQDAWFGMEQEYTLFEGNRPLGWPDHGFPAPQGGYYCGVGSDEVFGRELVEAHTDACIRAGIHIVGTNAEVMPAQWEFQIGAIGPLDMADELWLARWLLYRMGEDLGISATLHPKPVKGDWNGAGCHTNFSTKATRQPGGMKVIEAAMDKLKARHEQHIAVYGAHNIERLTGLHETAPINVFRWGSAIAARRSASRCRPSCRATATYFDPYDRRLPAAATAILGLTRLEAGAAAGAVDAGSCAVILALSALRASSVAALSSARRSMGLGSRSERTSASSARVTFSSIRPKASRAPATAFWPLPEPIRPPRASAVAFRARMVARRAGISRRR